MKKFYCKSLFCLTFVLMLFLAFDFFSMIEPLKEPLAIITKSESYLSGNVGADEIKPYISKVQNKDDYTKLIIGDSVCAQMFNGLQAYNDEYCIVGSNAAITMAGQYILAEQFLENHPNATEIYLIMLPTSIENGFSLEYGYQYVVMPLEETDTFQLLEEKTKKELAEIYGDFFVNKPVSWFIDKSAINRKLYLNLIGKFGKEKSVEENREMSILYLEKLIELCERQNVALYICSGPVSDIKEKHDEIAIFQEYYDDTILGEYFPKYTEQICFFPDDQFGDHTHFNHEWRERKKLDEKIKLMQEKTGYFKNLKFE